MTLPSVTGTIPCKYDGGPRPGPVTFGVLHDAETPLQAGYARSIASYFQRNTNQTSAHYMVDPVDTIAMLGDDRIAWHCGNGNPRSIGVEQAGYVSFTPAQWTTPDGLKQMDRVAQLMRDIKAVHGVGLFWMSDQQLRDAHAGAQVGGWATHAQCSRVLGGSTHTDPDPHYPFTQLMALANQEDDMPTADEIALAVWQHQIAARTRTVSAEVMLANTDDFANNAIPAVVTALLDASIDRTSLNRGPTTLRAVLAWSDNHVDAVMSGISAAVAAAQTAPTGGDPAALQSAIRQAIHDAVGQLTVKITA